MLQKQMINGLSGIISGGISIKDFSMAVNTDQITAKKILEQLIQNNIGKREEGSFYFEKGDRLKAAILVLKNGAPIDEVSQLIDWKDFEGLVAEILKEKDFATIKNLILTDPRREIDVVGVKLGIAMLIDCKHWGTHNQSSLKIVVKKQIERTKHYISKTRGAIVAPVIVTLYKDKVDFINRVPIVPIFQFSSFVDEFYGNLGEIKTMGSK